MEFLPLMMVCMALTGPAAAVDFGVGFSLSLDYGTTSVHFANGTNVDVAKIEGGWTYKEMMRAQNWSLPDSDETISHRDWTWPLFRTNLRQLGDRLHPWLCGHALDPQVNALSPMLRALKPAAESPVNTKVEDTIVVFPSRPSQSLRKAVDRAASQSSVRLPVRLTASAGEMAARSNGISGFSSYYDDCQGKRLILTVDWSRAALTAFVFDEECGLFQELRSIHNETLGSQYWSAGMKDAVSSELKDLIREPAYATSEDISHHVNIVVVLGEHGHDSRLRAVLKEVLSKHPAGDDVLAADKNMVDQVFAASRGAATLCFDRVQGSDMGVLCDVPIDLLESREL